MNTDYFNVKNVRNLANNIPCGGKRHPLSCCTYVLSIKKGNGYTPIKNTRGFTRVLRYYTILTIRTLFQQILFKLLLTVRDLLIAIVVKLDDDTKWYKGHGAKHTTTVLPFPTLSPSLGSVLGLFCF